jgi:hypothetical protein
MMANQGDSGSAPPRRRQHEDIWSLPAITALEIVRRRYRRPRKYQRAGRLVEIAEGIEIIIETDDEIPARALSPVLNVGRTQVTEALATGHRTYRFAVVDEDALHEGAPIRLGWIGLPPPDGAARFSYHAPHGTAEEEDEPQTGRRSSFLDFLLGGLRRFFGRPAR